MEAPYCGTARTTRYSMRRGIQYRRHVWNHLSHAGTARPGRAHAPPVPGRARRRGVKRTSNPCELHRRFERRRRCSRRGRRQRGSTPGAAASPETRHIRDGMARGAIPAPPEPGQTPPDDRKISSTRLRAPKGMAVRGATRRLVQLIEGHTVDRWNAPCVEDPATAGDAIAERGGAHGRPRGGSDERHLVDCVPSRRLSISASIATCGRRCRGGGALFIASSRAPEAALWRTFPFAGKDRLPRHDQGHGPHRTIPAASRWTILTR